MELLNYSEEISLCKWSHFKFFFFFMWTIFEVFIEVVTILFLGFI